MSLRQPSKSPAESKASSQATTAKHPISGPDQTQHKQDEQASLDPTMPMSPSVTHLSNLVIQLTTEIEALTGGPDSLKADATNALAKLYRLWADVLKVLAKVYEGKDPEQAGVFLKQAEGWVREWEWEGVFVEGDEGRSAKVRKEGEGENEGDIKGKEEEGGSERVVAHNPKTTSSGPSQDIKSQSSSRRVSTMPENAQDPLDEVYEQIFDEGRWQEVKTGREEEIEMMENELNDLKSKTGSKKSGGCKDLEEKIKRYRGYLAELTEKEAQWRARKAELQGGSADDGDDGL
ncbi:MAG: hypothetical protein Q9221_001468 [Calogaya cf. arnoldii]